MLEALYNLKQIANKWKQDLKNIVMTAPLMMKTI